MYIMYTIGEACKKDQSFNTLDGVLIALIDQA